eukprot:COSAG02_NODE_2722_length_8162_cov_5.913308_3_plen_98_part_00
MPRRARLTQGGDGSAPSLRSAPTCALCLAARAENAVAAAVEPPKKKVKAQGDDPLAYRDAFRVVLHAHTTSLAHNHAIRPGGTDHSACNSVCDYLCD